MGEQVITMPVVALRGLTILPGMVLHFDINRPKSVAAVMSGLWWETRNCFLWPRDILKLWSLSRGICSR